MFEKLRLETKKLLLSIEKHNTGEITKTRKTCQMFSFVKEIHKKIATSRLTKLCSFSYLSIIEKKLKNPLEKKTFLKKVNETNPNLIKHIKTPNFPRIMLIASLLIASKSQNDNHDDNEFWAKKACLSIDRLNSGELLLLLLINYKIHPSFKLISRIERSFCR